MSQTSSTRATTTSLTMPAYSNTRARGELYWRWEWDFRSSPQQLWPLVSNTDRFNRDAAVPAIENLSKGTEIVNGKRLLKMHRLKLGKLNLVPITWDEEPFEWLAPRSFGVLRRYSTGPLDYMRVYAELHPRADGGTHFTYETWVKPKNPLGWLAAHFQIGLLSRYEFDRTFRLYDAAAQDGQPLALALHRVQLAPGGAARVDAARSTLRRRLAGQPAAELIDPLVDLVRRGDDLTVARLRPFALADGWNARRRDVLEVCLHAVRAGLLGFKWEILCPLCRGAGQEADHLSELDGHAHCEVCHVDFDVNFDQAVEITFYPLPAIRPLEVQPYCVGGPQTTPHIVTQQLLEPGAAWVGDLMLEPGRYRLRAIDKPGGAYVRAEAGGRREWAVTTHAPWPEGEFSIDPISRVAVSNDEAVERLVILERLRWSDQAVTAAEVTTLQLFRDLFSAEALRPNQQISVGTLTVVFTDLKGSSRLYREVGDAPAFGMVMDHFDVLRQTIAEEDGAIVKTLGDAVMAVFRRPVNAIRSILRAQERLASASIPMVLKAGIHTGHNIAVTLNERLDYFGTNVNQAARLADLSRGSDIVISEVVAADPEVRELLDQRDFLLLREPFETTLRGFDDEPFTLYRIALRHLQ